MGPTSTVLDYLGREQPLGQRNLSGLPEESGGGAVTGPVTGGPTGGGPAAGDAGVGGIPASVGGATPGVERSPLLAIPGQEGTPALSLALGLLGAGSKATSLANLTGLLGPGSVGSFARDPGIEEAFQAFRAGERGDLGALAGFGDFGSLGEVSGGELALGSEGFGAASAAAAEGVAETAALTGFQALGQAAPYWAALTAIVDFIGEGKIPFQGIIDMIWPGTFGHSKDWMTFGTRLSNTLSQQEDAASEFARSLIGAGSPDAVKSALDSFKTQMGQFIPGYGQGVDPNEIPTLVGATGARHEGRIVYDANIRTEALRALQQAALQGLPPADRIRAFQAVLERYAGEQEAKRAANVEALRVQNEYQGSSQNTGSA